MSMIMLIVARLLASLVILAGGVYISREVMDNWLAIIAALAVTVYLWRSPREAAMQAWGRLMITIMIIAVLVLACIEFEYQHLMVLIGFFLAWMAWKPLQESHR